MQKSEKFLFAQVCSCREISYVPVAACFPLLMDLMVYIRTTEQKHYEVLNA